MQPLSEAREAHELKESGHARGQMVVQKGHDPSNSGSSLTVIQGYTMPIESKQSQTTPANSEYTQRVNGVIHYLRGNLDRQVKLEELANVACFSEYHFHLNIRQ